MLRLSTIVIDPTATQMTLFDGFVNQHYKGLLEDSWDTTSSNSACII